MSLKSQFYQFFLHTLYGRPPVRPGTFDAGKVSKVLLIRRNGIGDMICALPLIRQIRNTWPHVQLDMLCSESNARLLTDHKLIDQIFVYRRGTGIFRNHYLNLPTLLKPIRAEAYDVAIAIKGGFSPLLAIITYATQARWRLGYVPSRGHPLDFCLNLKIELPKEREHQVESCLRFLDPLGIPRPSSVNLNFALTNPQQEYAEQLMKQAGLKPKGFAVFNASAVRYESRWTSESLAKAATELERKYHLPVILCGIQQDEAFLHETHERAPSAIVKSVLPPTIHHFAALVSQSKFLLCGDGGPMHVAAAMGTPAFVLFSATDPQIWRPYNIPFAYAHHGRLVSDITVSEVMTELDQWLPGLS
jgi:heptosyltransferase III